MSTLGATKDVLLTVLVGWQLYDRLKGSDKPGTPSAEKPNAQGILPDQEVYTQIFERYGQEGKEFLENSQKKISEYLGFNLSAQQAIAWINKNKEKAKELLNGLTV